MPFMKYLALIYISLLSHAEDKSLLKPYPNEPLLNEIIAFQPLQGHHFNMKSKTNCGNGWLVEETEELVQCQMFAPGTSQLELYICDDAKSFCKRETVSMKTQSPDGFLGWLKYYQVNLLNRRYWSTPFKSGVSYNTVARGFNANEINKYLEKAKFQKKKLFVYFTQLSCPPCRLLKEMTFASDDFQEIMKDYIPIQIDIDLDVEPEMIKPLKVLHTPTMIVLDSNFKEVGRTSRLMSPLVLKSFLKGLPQEASESLNQSEDSPWEQEFNKLKTAKEKIEFLKKIKTDDFDFTQNHWLNYTYSFFSPLMGLKLPQEQALAQQALSLLALMEGKIKSASVDDLQKSYNLNSYYEMMGYLYKKTNALKELAALKAKHSAILEGFPHLPGVIETHQLAVLKADLSDDAQKKKQVLDDLRAKNQNDYTYDFWEASEAMQEKDFLKALAAIDKSLAIAKDRSFEKAFMMKLEVLTALNRKDEALKLIDDLMKEMKLPSNTSMKVHRFVQELRRTQFKLKGQT